MDNMTALVSCFARAYHYRNSNLPVFVDPVAEQMLTAEEYDTISRNMAQGIRFCIPIANTPMCLPSERRKPSGCVLPANTRMKPTEKRMYP